MPQRLIAKSVTYCFKNKILPNKKLLRTRYFQDMRTKEFMRKLHHQRMLDKEARLTNCSLTTLFLVELSKWNYFRTGTLSGTILSKS